jgi:DNA-binding response OmpR family regulator
MPSTCLIAAHDPWFIQLLRIYSEESGFRVVQAFEGQDVLPKVIEEKPIAILLQIDLPGQIQGREVLKLLKRDSATCSIPILAFSWQGGEDISDLEGNVNAHLQEPVTYESFLDALKLAGIHSQGRSRTLDANGYGAGSSLPSKTIKPDREVKPKRRYNTR